MFYLKKDSETLNLYEREKINGRYVSNKCGRDFLYIASNYYLPEKFNQGGLEFDNKKILGIPVYSKLAWTQLQFYKIGNFLKDNNLLLEINNRKIEGFLDFTKAIIFSTTNLDKVFSVIEESVTNDIVCGIDISLGMGGLLDHVMFIYGFDEENLYVLDTHQVSKLEYKLTDKPFVYKLPKTIIKKRWTRFGRIWVVKQG